MCIRDRYCDGYAEYGLYNCSRRSRNRRRGESAERMGRGHGPGILLLKTTSEMCIRDSFYVASLKDASDQYKSAKLIIEKIEEYLSEKGIQY